MTPQGSKHPNLGYVRFLFIRNCNESNGIDTFCLVRGLVGVHARSMRQPGGQKGHKPSGTAVGFAGNRRGTQLVI